MAWSTTDHARRHLGGRSIRPGLFRTRVSDVGFAVEQFQAKMNDSGDGSGSNAAVVGTSRPAARQRRRIASITASLEFNDIAHHVDV